jgi:gluconokinase
MDNPFLWIIVMGVSGSGKTTVGRLLAARLGIDYFDADSFHSPENIAKMASGIPLTDADRQPWLDRLRQLIVDSMKEGRSGVLACSALKERYRAQLVDGDRDVRVVYLKGSFDLIWQRMSARTDHYMKLEMLKSQFDALEEPKNTLVVSIDQTPGAICDEIMIKIRSSSGG